MNLFARALGGIFGDKAGNRFGLPGRMVILGAFLLLEGLGIVLFSQMTLLPLAVAAMLLFALFVKMSNGATYSVVPFISPKALGSVSGIVGAGGNLGAVLAGFLFKSEAITYRDGLLYLGVAVAVTAVLSLLLLNPFAARQRSRRAEPSLAQPALVGQDVA
jgi:NNP family nitrate/nitrite transporter-like MFS transporter